MRIIIFFNINNVISIGHDATCPNCEPEVKAFQASHYAATGNELNGGLLNQFSFMEIENGNQSVMAWMDRHIT